MYDYSLHTHECDAMPDDYVVYVGDETQVASLQKQYIWTGDDESFNIKIKFCPWCGKRLDECVVDDV